MAVFLFFTLAAAVCRYCRCCLSFIFSLASIQDNHFCDEKWLSSKINKIPKKNLASTLNLFWNIIREKNWNRYRFSCVYLNDSRKLWNVKCFAVKMRNSKMFQKFWCRYAKNFSWYFCKSEKMHLKNISSSISKKKVALFLFLHCNKWPTIQ